MQRKPISIDINDYPTQFHTLLQKGDLYDSSCSREARVLYIDTDGGMFLKSAPKGALAREAELANYFFDQKMGAEVLAYHSADRDWLLTARVAGEDCTHPDYLAEPKKLCELLAHLLRTLHDKPAHGCPVLHTPRYLASAEYGYKNGRADLSFGDFASADEAWRYLQSHRHLLQTDTLLHGDYCLPNVVLNDWHFGGFIDLGNGGIGDRHVDLFWGAWTLNFNLHTDAYRSRFFDAYGRERIDPERLRTVSAAEIFG